MSGWFLVAAIPNQYEASAKIYVDTDSFLEPLLRGITIDAMDVGEMMALVATKLLSVPVLERVALDAELVDASDEQQLMQTVQKLREKVNVEAEQLTRAVWPPRPPNFYTLGARDADPERAYAIVLALLDAFVEDAIGSTKQDTGAATRFLQDQIRGYEQRLLESERRLTEFRQSNMDNLPERGQSYFTRLQTVRDSLAATELQLREEEFRRRSLESQLTGIQPLQRSVTSEGTVVLSPLEQRIQNIQERLDELLLQYTPNHPEVVSLENTLERLQEQLAKDGGFSVDSASAANPMYQELRIQLGQVETNIAAITVRRDEYLQRIALLEEQVEVLPQIEAELAALTRDYEITHTNYNELLDRLESAELTSDANQTGQNVSFRIVEPPRLPTSPFFPNRLLLCAVVAVLAFGSGLGVTLLISQLKPAFMTVPQLVSTLGIPVLGSVGYSGDSVRTVWRRDLPFFLLVSLLAVVWLFVSGLFLTGFQINVLALIG